MDLPWAIRLEFAQILKELCKFISDRINPNTDRIVWIQTQILNNFRNLHRLF